MEPPLQAFEGLTLGEALGSLALDPPKDVLGLLDCGVGSHLSERGPGVRYKVAADLGGPIHRVAADLFVPRFFRHRSLGYVLHAVQNPGDASDGPGELACPVRHAAKLSRLGELRFYPGGELL